MGDDEVLDTIRDAPKAKLTQIGGEPLSGLAEIAAVIYLEASFHNWKKTLPSPRFTRDVYAKFLALSQMLRF